MNLAGLAAGVGEFVESQAGVGSAVAFNRRHRPHGHLFQNRHRSIVVEADAYGRELIRSLPLNPLRAGGVAS